MNNRRSMFMFGMRCVRCEHEIIAPRKTELLDDKVIRHLWHCLSCKARFVSFPRFPANAKSVKDVMFSVGNIGAGLAGRRFRLGSDFEEQLVYGASLLASGQLASRPLCPFR